MSKKTILAVDDDQDLLIFLENILDKDLYVLETAMDGAEGFKKALSLLPDLIILDVQMPVKDGFSTFRDLKADSKTSDIPVIMLTAIGPKRGLHFSKEEMAIHYGKGPEYYLDKPVSPEKLKRIVSDILN